MIYGKDGLKDLTRSLQAEGVDAQVSLFRGQEGLLVNHEGLTPDERAGFFPLWELNLNLELLAQRDFKAIVDRRGPNWSPVQHENRQYP